MLFFLLLLLEYVILLDFICSICICFVLVCFNCADTMCACVQARAILFSQFTDYLTRIGDILFDNGIPCVFVEGCVHSQHSLSRT